MIINPFNISKPEDKVDDKVKEFDFKIEIPKIQKHLISNFMDLLQKDLKENIVTQIKDYLIDNYNINYIVEQEKIINLLIDKMFGYDILQQYIENDEVTDIRVVAFDQVYIKKSGKWTITNTKFDSKEVLEEYVRYCVVKNNSNINYDMAMITVSDKKYNLRIEAGISPINPISPSLVIRIHRHNKNITLESLFLKDEMLDHVSYNILLDAVKNEKNIVISGKGGSGKTSLLRGIIDKIPSEKSITINEETMELYIDKKNVIQREVIENRDESKKITLEKLMKQALVMSNDILVVGELKGGEVTFFLDAIGTGHMGLATVHSNSARSTIDRLVTLFKRDIKAQQYSENFVTHLLASSIDYIIYLQEYKVCEIIQVKYNNITLKSEMIEIFRKDV